MLQIVMRDRLSASLFCFSKQVVTNLTAFCACAGVGQLFVFFIIKEFGSLVNVTVTISRKFFRCSTRNM